MSSPCCCSTLGGVLGRLSATKALLDQNPNPTLADIKKALVRNLCRCTGYHNIVRSIQYAAGKMKKKKKEGVSA